MAQPLVCRFPSWRRVFTIITCVWLSGSVLLPAARAQEALIVTISLESVTLDKLGTVTVTGTLLCSEPAPYADMDVLVTQPVGRFKSIRGYSYDLTTCDVTPVPFEVVVVPEAGRFAPGITYVTVVTYPCTDETCGIDSVTESYRLTHAP